MIRKTIIKTTAICLIAAASLMVPRAVKADALPCTVMYLDQAKAMKAAAEAEVAAAKVVLADKQAKFDAFRAAGITTGMDYLNALSEFQAAQRNLECKLSAVYNADNFIKDCQSKYAVEDNADKAYKALQSVNKVQAAKLEYDNAAGIAAQAAVTVNETKKAIAGYQTMLATSPSVQAQIDSLNALLAIQQADLAAKQALADQKKAAFMSSLNSDYASYNKKAIDYIYIRDNMRDTVVGDLNENGRPDGEDFFIAIGWN
ncbi:MAG: hypothetical protein K6F34_10155 [Lachnospiraceae bacterium]|nr:hypothetical protein [Lachnospiraceae bacterium]